MGKFAHISDIHLGFQKKENLQKVEQRVFEDVLDRCMAHNVDFILIPGDMFQSNIPDMRVQVFAFAKFREVYERGIPVYVVYGSHDFSPVSKSVIDLLNETGYITKVSNIQDEERYDDKISLDFTHDKKTGVKIAGIPGLKAGKDIEYYRKLDREKLEAEPGFKIFLFHCAVSEMRGEKDSQGEYMPISLMPKGFAYYAGGHMHKNQHMQYSKEYPHVVYPGTPFAGYHSDLNDNASGQKRGFYMVEWDNDTKVTDVQFQEVENTQYKTIKINAQGRDAASVNQELAEKSRKIADEKITDSESNDDGSIVIVKIEGELSTGRTTDIDFTKMHETLTEEGSNVLEVKTDRKRLSSKEFTTRKVEAGTTPTEIERKMFEENIGEVEKIGETELTGDKGKALAKRLLESLRQPKLENEIKKDYQRRITEDAIATLELEEKDDS